MQLITAILASLGVAQAVFLSLYLLLLKQGNRVANTLLAVVLIGLSIRIGKSVFNYFLILEPWHRNVGLSGLLLVGPSVFLYGKTFIDRHWRPTRIELLHFAPAALFFIFSGAIPNQATIASYVSYSLVLMHWLTYLIAAEYSRRKVIVRCRSGEVNRWYRYLVSGLALLWTYYLGVFAGLIPYYIGGALVYSVLIYIFTYLILHRHHFQSEKYVSSRASSAEANDLLQRVLTVFGREQPYLDPRLTLTALAEKLQVSARELSRAINEHRRQNFSEFVNQHRVQRATELLSQPDYQHIKLAVVAHECGFGNVASFNQAFKTKMQTTPSQYRARVQDSPSKSLNN